MEFSRELRAEVLTGRITVSFRLWRRPQVKVGGRYRVEAGHIEVDSIDLVAFSSIDEADLRRSGEDDLEALRRRAAHAGPVQDDTLLYRVEFHVVDYGRAVDSRTTGMVVPIGCLDDDGSTPRA